jgi:hypothetical protein
MHLSLAFGNMMHQIILFSRTQPNFGQYIKALFLEGYAQKGSRRSNYQGEKNLSDPSLAIVSIPIHPCSFNLGILTIKRMMYLIS